MRRRCTLGTVKLRHLKLGEAQPFAPLEWENRRLKHLVVVDEQQENRNAQTCATDRWQGNGLCVKERQSARARRPRAHRAGAGVVSAGLNSRTRPRLTRFSENVTVCNVRRLRCNPALSISDLARGRARSSVHMPSGAA